MIVRPEYSNYRPDIDGLRALAVALVVGYHAFSHFVPGGFIGVDVFFVISGYLITRLIFGELAAGHFSFVSFYARRARRIFPPLIVVLIATLWFGWLALLPEEYAALKQHVAASALFVANLQLWQEADYFDPVAATKPLLHLWSLGVEEQFYVVWPALLWVFGRRSTVAIAGILIVAAASFVVNIITVSDFPVAAFYSPLSRFWELAFGSILALAENKVSRPQIFDPWSNPLSILGVGAILVPAFLLEPQMRFPGWLALFPTIGAATIIAVGSGAWFNKTVLASRTAVFFGVISYSIYLWHWPILSFGRVLAGAEPPLWFRLSAVPASILAAWLTYRWLELPIRKARLTIAAPVAVLLAGIAAISMTSPWLPTLDPLRAAEIATMRLGAGMENAASGCGLSAEDQTHVPHCWSDRREIPSLAIWGDSKAGALFPALVRGSGPGQRWMDIGIGSCAPVTGVVRVSRVGGQENRKSCADANKIIGSALAASTNIRVVALVTAARIVAGQDYAEGDDFNSLPRDDAVIDGLANSAKLLHDSGKLVYFVVDNPTLRDPKGCIERAFGLSASNGEQCEISLEDHARATMRYRSLLASLKARAPFLAFLDPTGLLCDIATDRCAIKRGGKFLYSYSDHLSDVGNTIVGNALISLVNSATSM
jgi:peptidoglycan/LPS O-acetylase OafA/YrhL